MFDWYRRCSYDTEQKRQFHCHARAKLKALAKKLKFAPESFDIRSNQGGVAVSGEITLHHDAVYIQVCQPATGADSGILIRTCKGRRDFTGGRNHFEPLSLLDDLSVLVDYVRAVMSSDLSRISRLFGPLAARRSALG